MEGEEIRDVERDLRERWLRVRQRQKKGEKFRV